MKGAWLRTTLFEGTACADSRRTLADLKGRDRTSVTRSCKSETWEFRNSGERCGDPRPPGCQLYLQGRLAVGHGGRASSVHEDRNVEAVVGQSGGGVCDAEGFGQRVPGFLAEDGVNQLDDLILQREDVNVKE